MIELQAPNVIRQIRRVYERIVIRYTRKVGIRNVGQNLRRDAAELAHRNDVAGKWGSRCRRACPDRARRVVNGLRNLGENAPLHQRGWHRIDDGLNGYRPQVVVKREEPERLVSAVIDLRYVDGSANHSAGFIEAFLWTIARGVSSRLVDGPTGRIPDVAAHIEERRPVKCVGAGFGRENFDT